MDRDPSRCARCEKKKCVGGEDCFGTSRSHKILYDESSTMVLHKAASAIEARHYGKETRLREIILFAREMSFERLGLAFCVGLSSEAKAIDEILSRSFEVYSACCKVSGIYKESMGLEGMGKGKKSEVMCNPAGQAELLNREGCQLNILCGLCVGHDMIFTKFSKAPVTTFIVKDRVLAHNPAGAVYCPYVKRTLTRDD